MGTRTNIIWGGLAFRSRRNRYSAQGGGGIPSVLDDGNTFAWYDYMENVTTSGSDVTEWGDKTGNGNNLTSASQPPELTDTGILFNGTDEELSSGAKTLNQPEFIYMVFKQVTWALNDYVFDGRTTISGALTQDATSGEIKAAAGSFSAANSNLPINTYGIVRVLFNGALSKLVVNDTTPITGDFGSANMSGFTLGRRGQSTRFSNIEVKEIIIRKTADTEPDETAIYNYLKNKYSL